MATADIEFNFSEDILYECMKRHYTRIVSGFDPEGEILNNLSKKGTITMSEKKRIQGLPEERRAEALVDRLLGCQRPHAIAEFLEILFSSEERAYKNIAVEVHTAAQGMVASTLTPSLEIERSLDPASQDRGALQSRQEMVAPTFTSSHGSQQSSGSANQERESLQSKHPDKGEFSFCNHLNIYQTYYIFNSSTHPENKQCGQQIMQLVKYTEFDTPPTVRSNLMRFYSHII